MVLVTAAVCFWFRSSIWAAAFPFVIAIVLAYILDPAVGLLQNRVCRGQRVLAVVLLYGLVALIALPAIGLTGALVVREVVDLLDYVETPPERGVSASTIPQLGPAEGVADRDTAVGEGDTPRQAATEGATAQETEPPWYVRLLPQDVAEELEAMRAGLSDGENLSYGGIGRLVLSALATLLETDEETLYRTIKGKVVSRETAERVAQGVGGMAAASTTAIQMVVGWAGGAVRFVLSTLMVVIILFYILLDIKSLGLGVLRYLPPMTQGEVRRIWNMIDTQWSAFLRGQITVAAVVAVLGAIGYPLAGVNFGILIGLTAGACNIVPYLGPAVGFALAVGSTLIEQFPNGWGPMAWQLLAVVAVFTLIQWTEGFLITPYIMSEAVDLHPMFIFFVLILGGSIAGIAGMLLAVPAACAARILVRELYLIPLREIALESGIELLDSDAHGDVSLDVSVDSEDAGLRSESSGSSVNTAPEPREPTD